MLLDLGILSFYRKLDSTTARIIILITNWTPHATSDGRSRNWFTWFPVTFETLSVRLFVAPLLVHLSDGSKGRDVGQLHRFRKGFVCTSLQVWESISIVYGPARRISWFPKNYRIFLTGSGRLIFSSRPKVSF